jgi:glycosyltransferase involved in cell wall biosynthesis
MAAEPTIRVLLIAPSLRILGGQSVQATRLIACLSQAPSVQIDFQPIDSRLPDWLAGIRFLRTACSFAAYCARVMARAPRYDILHVFSAAYYSYSLWTLPALLFAKLYGKKIILNYRDGQAEDHLKSWRSAIPTIRKMDAIVTPSGFLVDVFGRFGFEAQSISNIIDMSQFRYRRRGKLRPLFLHNRILEPLYNIECTLRAFALIQERYPEARLTLAHDGPSRPELERFARELGLRHTEFIGRVPHPKIADLYDAADIYLTSPDFDCMPGSLLECFASGLPVIATRAGGIPYIAADEETALLIPCNDHRAMAACAFRLLEDQALVERLTARAYEECQRFAAGPVRDQWVALYRRLLKVDGSEYDKGYP